MKIGQLFRKARGFGDSGHVPTAPAGFLFLGRWALAALHLPQASALPFSHIPGAGRAGPGLLHILLCRDGICCSPRAAQHARTARLLLLPLPFGFL